MYNSFEGVVHHLGEFSEFVKLCYQGLEEVWKCDSDYLSYFEVLSGLKELRYPTVEILGYHDATVINEIVPLKDDMAAKRMTTIVVVNGNMHYTSSIQFYNPISLKSQYFHLNIML